jgi:glyoxylase-like metal-dependent hydrolase (beta-lactamase superfamily II)
MNAARRRWPALAAGVAVVCALAAPTHAGAPAHGVLSATAGGAGAAGSAFPREAARAAAVAATTAAAWTSASTAAAAGSAPVAGTAIARGEAGAGEDAAAAGAGDAASASAGDAAPPTVVRIAGHVYMATSGTPGNAHVFLVVTGDGSIVVNTGSAETGAVLHQALLQASAATPVRYIVLTHAGAQETGGIASWHEAGTRIVARLPDAPAGAATTLATPAPLAVEVAGAARRRPATTATRADAVHDVRGPDALHDADVVQFADHHRFSLGGIDVELLALPGRHADSAAVWLPQSGIVIADGDFEAQLPDLYAPGAPAPRSVLAHATSLDRLRALSATSLLGSRGLPVRGADRVRTTLTRQRAALRYLHDAVAAGLAGGADLATLLRDVRLPPSLAAVATPRQVAWTVRGMQADLAGWYDGDPTSLFLDSDAEALALLAQLAGGASVVAEHAAAALAGGDAVMALRLTDAALRADAAHRASWEVRHEALVRLQTGAGEPAARSALDAAIDEAEAALVRSVVEALSDP